MFVTRLVDVLISPLGGGLLLALLLWLWRARLPRALWYGGLVLEVLCLLTATPAGANLLVALQERRVPDPAVCAAPTPATAVLLAGGVRRSPAGATDVAALNDSAVQRTLAAANLMRERPGTELVISGGSRPGDAVAESTLMAELAGRLGVPAAAIRTETGSRTTWDNATGVRALKPPVPRRIWLLTSALHMPRALIAFRAAGFEPCAWPVDFRTTRLRDFDDFLPRGGAVARTEAVLHELVGELAYRWRAARAR